MAFTREQNQQILDSIFGQGKVQAGEGRGDAALRAGTAEQRMQYQTQRRAAGDTAYDVSPLGATQVPITQVMAQNVNNPQLPTGTTYIPTLQNVQQNELLDPTKYQLGASPTIGAPTSSTNPVITGAPAINAPQVDYNQILQYLNQQAGQYDPTKVGGQTPQATTQQGTVSELATVQGQLAKLYADANGEVPAWARGAQEAAKSEMAKRGIGKSSISAAAVTEAYLRSALPIAAADAATYFQMDMKNLDNRQATELENTRLRQQSLLTDVAIDNASKQFNASSALQTQQFTAQLISSIQTQNASLKANMDQFNAAEKNKIAAQNAANTIQVEQSDKQLKVAVDKFNADMVNSRQQFNSNMAFAIDQANVVWRRSINTQNNAAVNAANAQNVQNGFNISQTALNNLWQMYRDTAAWNFQAATNQSIFAYNAGQAANNRQATRDAQEASLIANGVSGLLTWLG